MADIFSNDPGVVSVFQGPGTPLAFYLENWGDIQFFKSIITGFQVESQGGVQFMHTLRDFIYIYVFGERIGTVIISGLSFQQLCPGGDSGHGLEDVIAYYGSNRVLERADPVTMVFGLSTVFYGFLTKLTGGVQDPSTKMGSFALQFQTVPL